MPDQSATTIAKLLVEEIFCRHGIPEHLISDRGATFSSSLIQNVCVQIPQHQKGQYIWLPAANRWLGREIQLYSNQYAVKMCRKELGQAAPICLICAYRATIQESTK